MRASVLVAIALLPFANLGSEIPPLELPAGAGINIHFISGHERDLDLIAVGGFKFIRMDFGWAGIERHKGQYDWSEYDQLLANLEKRKLGAVFIFDYSNPLYEETVASTNPISHQAQKSLASPQHPESIQAYAAWAAASARHYHGRHIIWEIWNEPNIQFWSPKPDAHQYAALALATAKAVRESEPNATIVGPASSTFPWRFLETLCQSGVLQYLDAVSVHPYRDYQRGPETASADYERLRALIDKYAPAERRGKIPILSGEWGYASHLKGVPLERQAAFAVRQQLANLLNHVPLSIWYDWKNDGRDPNDAEQNFGIVEEDLNLKPAYTALQTLNRQLRGCHIIRREAGGTDQDYLLVLGDAGGAERLAAWTTGAEHEVSLPAGIRTTRALAGVDGMGKNITVESADGRGKLKLTALPSYFQLSP